MNNASAVAALPDALDRLFSRTAHGIRPGLTVTNRMLDTLGQPQESYPYIHVAGTNGKGSVCAMLASILKAAGYHTGCYTSPHLVAFNERIMIDGAPMPDADLAQWIQWIETVADAIAEEDGLRAATFFECATAMAFAYFKARAVDWAVIETGLGGRWDATNTGTPACAAITPIGIDHTNFLGHELVTIAKEKAGIIKPGIPVVVGALVDEAMAIVQEAAAAVKAPLYRADDLVSVQRLKEDWNGQKIKVTTQDRALPPVTLPLIGRHQVENVAIAVGTLEVLQVTGQVDVTDEALCEGLRKVQWLGRGQVLCDDPVTLLDVAHNPHGAEALMRALRDRLKPKQPLGMVIGFMKDKDVEGCLRVFAQSAARFWTVPVPGERAMDATTLAEMARRHKRPVDTLSLAEGFSQAQAWAKSEGGVVCIAGSLYLAGEVLRLHQK